MTNAVLEAIRSRRMVRALTDAPVDRAQLEAVLEAARWAPNAGNRRIHRFVVVENPIAIRLLRMMAPGMFQRPTAVIAICVDFGRAAAFGMSPDNRGPYVDVGTAAQTMLLAAHSLGLGAGVVTSFSRAGAKEILNLPDGWSAELLVCLGHPAAAQPPGMRSAGPRVTWQSLTTWERFPPRSA